MTEKQNRSLQWTVDFIKRNFGTSCICTASALPSLSVLPTGLPELDQALGIGGIPRGKIVEISGPESAGKTALALHMAKMAQTAVYIDADYGLTPEQLAACEGVHFLSVETLEDALTVIMKAATVCDMIVIDTLTALPAKVELSEPIGTYQLGAVAKILSAAFPQLVTQLAKTGCTLVIVNQIRTAPTIFGNPEKIPGGCALRHYAAIHLDVRRIEILREKHTATGQRIRIRSVKNKCAAPLKEIRLDLLFDGTLHSIGDLRKAAGIPYETNNIPA